MIKYRIKDKDDSGVLNFDLKDIFSLVDFDKSVEWVCSFIEVESNPEDYLLLSELINKINNSKEFKIYLSDLNFISNRVSQTTECKITGKYVNDCIVIEAIDTSFWEITFIGEYFERYISDFRSRFNDIETIVLKDY